MKKRESTKRLFTTFFSLFVLPLLVPVVLFAQSFTLKGVIKGSNGEGIYLATVHEKDGSRHAYTDEKGHFTITLPKGKTLLTFSCMGYDPVDREFVVGKNIDNIEVTLKELSLGLDEVVVTARSVENKAGTSVYEIGEQAIKQVQATNLSDVLQLLPGKKITPPALNTVQQADLRTAASSTANNFGTSIIVDGVQISNDGNMQADNPASSLGGGKAATGMGVDLRSINMAGVEKIEVISGVASPKYGDLTSGAVIVKSKVGRSPLMVSANLNPAAYQFSASQGLQLPKKLGFVNGDVSYTYSDASPVDRKDYFHNINAAVRWRTNFNQARDWYNTISFNLNTSHNGQRVDPDEIYENIRKVNNQRYILSMSGSLKFLGTTSYSLSGSLESQYSSSFNEMTDGPFPMISGLEAGTFFTTYSPMVYEKTTTIEGMPVNISGRVEADQDLKVGDFRFTFNTGVQYSYVKNYGKGRISTGDVIGLGGMAASRAANFHEIPASKTYSAYHETNMRRITDKSRHELRLGARYDFMNDRYHLLSPRLSYSWLIHNLFKVRASWGVAYKAPAMIQLFPGPSYHDFTNLSHFATNPKERLAIVTTVIVQPTNEHLKPSKGDTKEIGFDIEGEKFSIRTTYFHKELTRGIYRTSELLVLDRQNYKVVDRPVDQMPIVAPIQGEGAITKLLRTQGVVKNSYVATTDGIEAVIIPPKIEATNTSFMVSLSYMVTEENDYGFRLQLPSSNIGESGTRYGVYRNPNRTTYASNGNVTVTQHIPSLRLIFNLVAELNFVNYNKRTDASLYPESYYDGEGVLHDIPFEDRDKPEYANLKLPEATYLTINNPPFYTNYHLQVRKETKQGHSFSFFANNAFWYNPIYYRENIRRTLNAKISFGFGISLKITR